MAATQFWALLASTVGLFAAPSFVRLIRGGAFGATLTDVDLLQLLVLELVLGWIWTRRLTHQGWRLASITEPFAIPDLLRGAWLAGAAWIAYSLSFTWAEAVVPRFAAAARAVSIHGRLSLAVVLLVSVINPVAEEFLYLGVIVASRKRKDALLAVSAGALARVCVHLYQGPSGILAAATAAVVFGAYYLRTRRLWPVVAAHGLMDLVGLAGLS